MSTRASGSKHRFILPLLALAGAVLLRQSQPVAQIGPSQGAGVERNVPLIQVLAAEGDARTFVPAPPSAKFAPRTATIDVTYTGFSAEARAAFQAAVDIWATQITSPVPIVVEANFTTLGQGVLGSAGPTWTYRDFSGATSSNTWYPIALANKLYGGDLNTSDADITANFASNRSDWYYGTDGQTPSGRYDFQSVVMHELGHGLGFLGSLYVAGGLGTWGTYPYIWDRFAENGSGVSLIDTLFFPRNSTALAAQLQGGSVYFDGTNTRAANSGAPARLYAPATWASGSSYSHLDETTYAAGNSNSLMTPYLSSAEAIHDPGAITRAMFTDMGWTTSAGCSYSLSASSATFAGTGGTGSVAVTSTSGCGWTATSNQSWVSITAGSSGSGSGTVSYTVAANTTTGSRTATLTIAGQSYTITQNAGSTTTAGTLGTITLDGDTNRDVFVYSPTSGAWTMELGNGAGSFTERVGSWSAAWTVQAGDFNGDGLTDFFLYNVATGQWFKTINNGAGDFTYFTSTWSAGWTPIVMELSGDGRSDVFLYSSASGIWFKCVSAGAGTGEFTYYSGMWSPGWEVYPADFNGDGKGDLFLFSRATGQWFRVVNDGGAGFTYYTESWSNSWQIVPGDYDGDGLTDIFLYYAVTGQYFVCWNSGTTFTYSTGTTIAGATTARAAYFDGSDSRADVFLYNPSTGQWTQLTDSGTFSGTWSPNWEVYVTDFNSDGVSDLLLYNTTTGQWFQAITTTVGSFSYTTGTWSAGLTIVTTSTRLP